jgi:hypothetical protein
LSPGFLLLKALWYSLNPAPDRKDAELAMTVSIVATIRAAGPGSNDDANRKLKMAAERGAQAEVLRDIFNPFRAAAAFDPAWRDWQGGPVPRLARRIYQERRWDDMPVLAEALERAGGADADMLAHCRGPGPHVRGCWVVDLILKKS